MRWKTAVAIATVSVLCSIGILQAAEVGGPEAEKDLQKFQGTWVMVSGERDGKSAADEHVVVSRLVYKGNGGLLIVPNQHHEPIIFEIVKLDTTKKPNEMHFIRRSGPHAGKTIIAIYEFDGDHQYKFAFDPTGSATLKEFATKEGTGHIRNTWKRAKP